MEALNKYMKKTKSAPFGKTKPKGTTVGEPKGADQYAKTEGTPIVSDSDADEKTSVGKVGAYESYRPAAGGKKKRPYVD